MGTLKLTPSLTLKEISKYFDTKEKTFFWISYKIFELEKTKILERGELQRRNAVRRKIISKYKK